MMCNGGLGWVWHERLDAGMIGTPQKITIGRVMLNGMWMKEEDVCGYPVMRYERFQQLVRYFQGTARISA